MNRMKIVHGLAAIALMAPFLISCVPPEHQSKEYKKIVSEVLDLGEKTKIGDALSQRIKDGATLNDFLPSTGVIALAMMPAILGIIGGVVVVFLFLMLYHRRAMAMIEKGTYEQSALKIRWDLVMLFAGLILVFMGPAVSIYMVSSYGVYGWSVTGGIIPLFIGMAFLVFYKIYPGRK